MSSRHAVPDRAFTAISSRLEALINDEAGGVDDDDGGAALIAEKQAQQAVARDKAVRGGGAWGAA